MRKNIKVWKQKFSFPVLFFVCRNNLGGPTTAIAGFCSYFFDGDKEIVLDKLYDRPSGTITELRTLDELTGNKKTMSIIVKNTFVTVKEVD